MRTWTRYILYTLVICTMAFSRQYFTVLAGMTFIGLWNLGAMIINVLLGVLLGLEDFISEFKKKSPWKVNIPKLVSVGLPSLIIGFSPFIFFGKSTFIGISTSAIFANSGVFQLILGYAVVTSFYKADKQESRV